MTRPEIGENYQKFFSEGYLANSNEKELFLELFLQIPKKLITENMQTKTDKYIKENYSQKQSYKISFQSLIGIWNKI